MRLECRRLCFCELHVLTRGQPSKCTNRVYASQRHQCRLLPELRPLCIHLIWCLFLLACLKNVASARYSLNLCPGQVRHWQALCNLENQRKNTVFSTSLRAKWYHSTSECSWSVINVFQEECTWGLQRKSKFTISNAVVHRCSIYVHTSPYFCIGF